MMHWILVGFLIACGFMLFEAAVKVLPPLISVGWEAAAPVLKKRWPFLLLGLIPALLGLLARLLTRLLK